MRICTPRPWSRTHPWIQNQLTPTPFEARDPSHRHKEQIWRRQHCWNSEAGTSTWTQQHGLQTSHSATSTYSVPGHVLALGDTGWEESRAQRQIQSWSTLKKPVTREKGNPSPQGLSVRDRSAREMQVICKWEGGAMQMTYFKIYCRGLGYFWTSNPVHSLVHFHSQGCPFINKLLLFYDYLYVLSQAGNVSTRPPYWEPGT